MQPITVSVSELKKAIEEKAFAYGVSATISTLLGEYVIRIIRDTKKPNRIIKRVG